MTDPVSLLRVPVLDLRSGESVLDDEAAHYVVRVRRLCAGDRFVAFDPSARVESDAEVTSTSREVTCRFGSLRVAQGVPRREVTLIQGIGKGEKPERVVRDATALGVSRVILVESARTVARVIGGGDRASRKASRLCAVALDAARQSGRGDVPDILGPVLLADALAREPGASTTTTTTTSTRRLCLAPGAGLLLRDALSGLGAAEGLALLVGPEGGLTEEELGAADAAGFSRVRLGGLVLRTETAATAVMGAVLALADVIDDTLPDRS